MKLKKLWRIIGFSIWQLFLYASKSFAEYRFPKPEFTTDYAIPEPTQAQPVLANQPLLALILLCVVMGLTAYCLYKRRSRIWLRILIVASVLYFGFYHGGCVCSIGSIQNVAHSLFNPDSYIPWIVIAVFFLPLIASLFFGRIFCGSACPLGAIQELVILRPMKVPRMIDTLLKIVPYVYLGLAVVFVACDMGFIICRYDPFVGFFRLSGSVPILIAGGVILFLGTVVARPYCRYLCPYSVLLRWMAKFSARKVSITPDHCIVCHLCKDACPVGAIQPPKPQRFAESKEQALTRLRWVAALTPILILCGILFGLALYKPMEKIHPDIKMVKELKLLNNTVVKERDIYNRDITSAEAFLEKGENPDDLVQKAVNAQQKIKIALVCFGIYIAMVFIGSLVKTIKRRTNIEYTVDSGECVACARCYQWCPRQHKTEENI